MYFSPSYAALSLALAWLKQRAAPEAVVAGSLPAWSYLESGLKTVMLPLANNRAGIQRLFDSVPVSYVIVNRSGSGADNEPIPGLLRKAGDKWRLVYSSPRHDADIFARRWLHDSSSAR